jgi:antitoxin MazE
MLAKAQKWGNSLAVRLPKNVAEECGITVDSAVEVLKENNCIVIKLVKRKLTLDALLAQVTEMNLHSEVLTGKPIGKELL